MVESCLITAAHSVFQPLSTYGVCAPKECDIYDVTNLLNSSLNCLGQYLNSKEINKFLTKVTDSPVWKGGFLYAGGGFGVSKACASKK